MKAARHAMRVHAMPGRAKQNLDNDEFPGDTMNDKHYQLQKEIIASLRIRTDFDAAEEVERRVAFLVSYLRDHHAGAYVLGISGGIDSTTAGRMAQLAVERARQAGQKTIFIAMRLPYGSQADEAHAREALDFIRPDLTVTVDIQPASDAMMRALGTSLDGKSPEEIDFLRGNIKSRQRMIAQYAVAGAHSGIVVGTDHGAEAVMGFFTKYGDGGVDLSPLAHLNKRQVRSMARELHAPLSLIEKTPTADLEDLAPQKPDEVAHGVNYDEIDDFLEGKAVSDEAAEKIVTAYLKTRHKRMMPAEPPRP